MPCGLDEHDICTICDFVVLIQNLLNLFITQIIWYIALLMMLYAGAKLADLVDTVERVILKLCRQDPKTYYTKGSDSSYSAGIAFPVGVNINNVIAIASCSVGSMIN